MKSSITDAETGEQLNSVSNPLNVQCTQEAKLSFFLH